MTAAAVTDAKGDRSKRPSQQDDPDLYVHVAERRDDGIVVRGAKAHTSGSISAEELIVIPTRALLEGEEDYAVSFAVPVDAPGPAVRRPWHQLGQENEMEAPISSHDDLAETLTIFNDVFVPYERVFLLGEHEFAGDVANTFSSVNRQGYLGTEAGKLRIFIGAAQRVAELNGVAHVGPHPRQDRPADQARALDLGVRAWRPRSRATQQNGLPGAGAGPHQRRQAPLHGGPLPRHAAGARDRRRLGGYRSATWRIWSPRS